MTLYPSIDFKLSLIVCRGKPSLMQWQIIMYFIMSRSRLQLCPDQFNSLIFIRQCSQQSYSKLRDELMYIGSTQIWLYLDTALLRWALLLPAVIFFLIFCSMDFPTMELNFLTLGILDLYILCLKFHVCIIIINFIEVHNSLRCCQPSVCGCC